MRDDRKIACPIPISVEYIQDAAVVGVRAGARKSKEDHAAGGRQTAREREFGEVLILRDHHVQVGLAVRQDDFVPFAAQGFFHREDIVSTIPKRSNDSPGHVFVEEYTHTGNRHCRGITYTRSDFRTSAE